MLMDIIECPDQVNALWDEFPYAFKCIGKKSHKLEGARARWYDRSKSRVLVFATSGRLVFPTGLKSDLSVFGAPVPKYPFFIEHANRLTFVSSSYWMYKGQVEQKGGVNPLPPSREDMDRIVDVGESEIKAETRWVEDVDDRIDETDDDGIPFVAVPRNPESSRNPEDADPVPTYNKRSLRMSTETKERTMTWQ